MNHRLPPLNTAGKTSEEIWRYGVHRLRSLGRLDGQVSERPGRSRSPEYAAPEKTIVGRDQLIGRPSMTQAAAVVKQGDFFTAPKSDPVKAAAALAELRKFKEALR